MVKEKRKIFDYEKILLFLLCIGFAYIFYSKSLAIENTNYGIEQLHQYDSKLFENNIGLLESDFSPRYFANVIVSFFMKLFRVSWAGVVTFIIRLNFLLYAVAVAKTVCSLTQKRLLFGVILISCVFRSSLGTLAGYGLNGAMDTFIGTGTALVLLAVSFLVGEKKNWMAVWILLALATLLHVHEGIWGGCVVGVLWLSGAVANKRFHWKALKGLPIYVAVMLCVTVPTLLNGETVDVEKFTEIYVYDRTALHLLPTCWGMGTIFKCFLLVFVPTIVLALLHRRKKDDFSVKEMFIASILTVTLWVTILVLEYIVTVVVPNTALITMYMTKCFKYITYIAMLLYLKIADKLYQDKRYLTSLCAILLVILGFDYNSAVCAALAVVLIVGSIYDFEDKILDKSAPFYFITIKISGWQIICLALCLMHGWNIGAIMCVAVLFATEFVVPFVRQQRFIYRAVCILAVFIIGFSIQGKIIQFDKMEYISGDDCLREAMGNNIYELSLALKGVSDTGQEFLADPYDATAGWVQLVSERNCYAIVKCTPSSKKAVLEWYDRIQQTKDIGSMSDEELAELMEEIGIQYVFLSAEQYAVMENSDCFEQIALNKTAAIYRLK